MEESASESNPGSESKQSRLSWYSPVFWTSTDAPTSHGDTPSARIPQQPTTNSLTVAHPARRPSVCLNTKGDRKSHVVTAKPTKVHAVATLDRSSAVDPAQFAIQDRSKSASLKQPETEATEHNVAWHVPANSAEPGDRNEADRRDALSTGGVSGKSQASKWYAWWSRPDDQISQGALTQQSVRTEPDNVPGTTALPVQVEQDEGYAERSRAEALSRAQPTLPTAAPRGKSALQWDDINGSATPPRSWFPSWNTADSRQSSVKEVQLGATPPAKLPTTPNNKQSELNGGHNSHSGTQTAGWAFWLSGQTKQVTSTPGGTKRQIGELAVADSPSQSHPELAQFNEQLVAGGQSRTRKRGKISVKQSESAIEPNVLAAAQNDRVAQRQASNLRSDDVVSTTSNTVVPSLDSEISSRPASLVVPAFDIYPKVPVTGYLQRLSTYVGQTFRLLPAQQSQFSQHVFASDKVIKIQRAIAIGVHGFFPSPMIQRLLGPPTGTSIKFANAAAAEIKRWCDEHQPHAHSVEIEKVALEGEGLVGDRVALLWKLLLNWLSHLRQADFIFIACHSQGVPVACMLCAKLIQLGCLSPKVRVGICAMAGINLGPFPEYKVRFFGGSALELFDFADPDSKVSKAYAEALDVCLRNAVRITYIGSLDDQLVGLESSLHMPLIHPYVSRAVFIDGRSYTPNFLTHLVVFALKMRDLGHSDHGLIKELSGPLAGSLVGGDGHSRLYDDSGVYRRAIQFALESTDMPLEQKEVPLSAAGSLLASDKQRAMEVAAARRASLSGYPSTQAVANSIRRGSFPSSTALPGIAPVMLSRGKAQSNAPANPFYLPWAMRGIMEERAVKQDPLLRSEAMELTQEFDHWNPSSKALKDVRWRLEGLRSVSL